MLINLVIMRDLEIYLFCHCIKSMDTSNSVFRVAFGLSKMEIKLTKCRRNILSVYDSCEAAEKKNFLRALRVLKSDTWRDQIDVIFSFYDQT